MSTFDDVQVSSHLTLRRRRQVRHAFGILSNADFQLVMIFFQIAFHFRGQTQVVDAIVSRVTHDSRTAKLLQWKHVIPVERRRQHRLEEHHRGWVFVVFNQAGHCRCCVHRRIMRVKAELVIPLLDSGVKRSAVFAEWNGEQIIVLCGIAKKKSSFGLSIQQLLGFVSIHLAPVVTASCDLL